MIGGSASELALRSGAGGFAGRGGGVSGRLGGLVWRTMAADTAPPQREAPSMPDEVAVP